MTQQNTTADENPYAVSLTCQGDVDILKPIFGRQHFAQQIRTYVAGASSAVQFLTAISPYTGDDDVAGDTTTLWVAETMELMIDRNTDRVEKWPKERWNFVQRILLLIPDDCRC